MNADTVVVVLAHTGVAENFLIIVTVAVIVAAFGIGIFLGSRK